MSIDPGTECANVPSDNELISVSIVFTIGYVMVTYLFMVFYLVRNDLFRLSTIYSNIRILSILQSYFTLLRYFGGFGTLRPSFNHLCPHSITIYVIGLDLLMLLSFGSCCDLLRFVCLVMIQ